VTNSPATRAGLLVGDLIFAVDRMPVNSASGLSSLVKHSSPGTRLQFDLLRKGQLLTASLVVGRKSLDLGPNFRAEQASSDPGHLVDSLRQALEVMRQQMNRLENRINSLDQD
jgi:C-terminal processing protease CtpA/Prc